MEPYIKKIILPSGRILEVVYYDGVKEEDEMSPLPPRTNASIESCPGCRSTYAALGEYGLMDDIDARNPLWFAHIMCGRCLTWRYVIAHEDEFAEWEESGDMARGMFAIERAIQAIARDSFATWAETFIAAIDHDAILPEDF